MRLFASLIILIVLGASCTTQKTLYNYDGYDEAVYQYTKNSDAQSMDQLLKVYEQLIAKTGTRQIPPPGLYADYGFILIKKGEVEKGKDLLKKEIALYPESSYFVGLILKRMEQ